MIEDLTGGDFGRVAQEHGDAHRFIVGGAFVAELVLAKVIAVVGAEDDDGVIGKMKIVEGLENAADAVVGAGDAAEVVEHALVAGAMIGILGFAGEDRRLGKERRLDVKVGNGSGRFVGESVLGAVRGRAGIVGGFEAKDDVEGFVFELIVGLAVFEPGDKVVGRDVIDPALGGGDGAVNVEGAVLVLALADEGIDDVEAGAFFLLDRGGICRSRRWCSRRRVEAWRS